MKNDHVISLLEENRFTALSAQQVSIIESHVEGCPDCLKAYTASSAAGAMLKARVAETIEPSPFFKTRVMAALREKQPVAEPPALVWLWRTAGKLASTMALSVLVLLSLTLFGSESQPAVALRQPVDSAQLFGLAIGGSVESMIFDDDEAQTSDEMTEAQALEAIFEAEDADESR
jgi:hypothetical protein